jgi:hypothetical protein
MNQESVYCVKLRKLQSELDFWVTETKDKSEFAIFESSDNLECDIAWIWCTSIGTKELIALRVGETFRVGKKFMGMKEFYPGHVDEDEWDKFASVVNEFWAGRGNLRGDLEDDLISHVEDCELHVSYTGQIDAWKTEEMVEVFSVGARGFEELIPMGKVEEYSDHVQKEGYYIEGGSARFLSFDKEFEELFLEARRIIDEE